MPDGKTHTSVTALTAAYMSVFLTDKILVNQYPPHCLLMVAGCLSGILLSPDLDVDSGYIGDSILRRRLGCFIATLWHAYWHPYAVLIPHRSWVSHFPIISTAIRAVIAFWWILLIPGATSHWMMIAWFISGLLVADVNHAFMDFVRPDSD